MDNLLEQGSNWLEDKRHEHLTTTVTYQRDSDTVDLKATIGKTPFRVDNGFGILEHIESRDYLILKSDLILASQNTLPERGDRIRELRDGVIYVYEVLAPAKEPHYRLSDAYGKTLRIHTKHVDTVAV